MNYHLYLQPRKGGWLGRVYLLFFVVLTVTMTSSQQPTNNNRIQVFEQIESRESGIDFINKIVEDVSTRENLFDFDYFYNGAGVGIADINNDGLQDIFFCGNQVDNKLYLNQGNMKFKDISESSLINQGKKWSSGVTFADVNNDGWLDIYVSQGGPYENKDRSNLLLINQQDLTFKESAEEYNLADKGISTQSSFFDYDKDGDLDCIVMNENPLYGIEPISFYNKIRSNTAAYYGSYTHLYRNDDGKFTDISITAGLVKPTFGLGLVISDINEDGWLDIYIANDYYIPDALYINNKNGTFTDEIKERTNQISFYGMGADISDVNNDGRQDIFVLDMASNDHVRAKTLMASMSVENFDLLVNKLKYPYQYMFNSLQVNAGNNKYHNVAQLAGIANTDWSWAGLMVDLDNDEYKDIFVTNGYRRYALDNDLKAKVTAAKIKYDGKVPLDVKQELYDAMPSEKLPNLLYRNQTKLKFNDVATEWGLGAPSFSNGAAYADLDNDGDLELVTNNIDDQAFLYKNLSVEKKLGNYLRVKANALQSESFAKVVIKYNGQSQMIETKRVHGYLSATEEIAHFGMGAIKKVDTIRIEWNSGLIEEKYNVKTNNTVVFNESGATKSKAKLATSLMSFENVDMGDLKLFYIHSENNYNDFEKEILLPHKQSTLGPFIAEGDVNGDNLSDLFIGGAAGQQGRIFIQNVDGFTRLESPALANDAKAEDMEALFFDIDQDNDNDLYVVSGGNEFEPGSDLYSDRLYLNDGSGNFTKSQHDLQNPSSGKSICAIDYDKDGDLDLIIGNRIIPQSYPKSSPSRILENQNGELVDVTAVVAAEFENFGIVNKVISTDFNNDGWTDFIAVGEWTHIGMFENKNGVFRDVSKQSNLTQFKGWWFNVAETDVNNDGFKDYIVGNVGLNTKFKASLKKPFKVFGNDFDSNGSFDIVLSKQYKGDYVPVRGKECSTQQMPFISEKFKTYNAFAQATMDDIYGEKLNTSVQLEATEFKSILLLNNGNGGFEKVDLPIEAQAFPILDCEFYDINQDGYDDIILAGNIYNTEVETPRLDGGTGLVMLSDQQGNYKPVHNFKTGLYIPGNVKDIQIINHKGKDRNYLIAAKNNDLLSIFSMNNKPIY